MSLSLGSWFLDLSALFDFVIMILLLVTIGYAIVLNRRLKVLREARGGMRELVTDFSAAVTKAESGLAGLRGAADESGARLQEQIERGDRLADDLALLEKRAVLALERLERVLHAARGEQETRSRYEASAVAAQPIRATPGALEPEHRSMSDSSPRADGDTAAFRNPWRELRDEERQDAGQSSFPDPSQAEEGASPSSSSAPEAEDDRGKADELLQFLKGMR